jgi:hypothetical protein
MTADMLSKLVTESLNNRTEQSMDNMNEISNALINIANYVNTSKATINETVRQLKDLQAFINSLFLCILGRWKYCQNT